jgi:hypothetical protein
VAEASQALRHRARPSASSERHRSRQPANLQPVRHQAGPNRQRGAAGENHLSEHTNKINQQEIEDLRLEAEQDKESMARDGTTIGRMTS